MIKYQDKCHQIEKLMKENSMSFNKACGVAGIAPSTIRPYFKEYLNTGYKEAPERHNVLLDGLLNTAKKLNEVLNTASTDEILCNALKPIPHIATSKNISFVWNDEIINVSIDSNKFQEIKDALNSGNGDLAFKLSSIKNQILSYSYKDIEIENDTLTYKGKVFENSIVDKIVNDMNEGNTDFEKYVKFIDNMMSNPSHKIKKRIYDFIVAEDIKISDDGFILAFKSVKHNYYDRHSNTMDNTPGNVVSMQREDVDDDDSVTCSSGLHVCSKSYIPYFSNSTSKIVLCKVNPKDVVSIPIDYNDAKMRCCEYTVLEDVTNTFLIFKVN